MFPSTIAPLAATRAVLSAVLAEEAVGEYLDRLQAHHRESWEHSLRVGPLAADLGAMNRLDRDDRYLLAYAGLLHDIGKLRIPRQVLQHRGLLDPEGREVMREHSRHGFSELDHPVPAAVREIVVSHHEFCRDPYPRAGADNGPTPAAERRALKPRMRRLAEMVAVADMLDALTHRRSYKPALTLAETAHLLRQEYTGDARLATQLLERCGGADLAGPQPSG